jgi:hypothetical protein
MYKVAGPRGLGHIVNEDRNRGPTSSPIEHNFVTPNEPVNNQASMTARNKTLLAPNQVSPRSHVENGGGGGGGGTIRGVNETARNRTLLGDTATESPRLSNLSRESMDRLSEGLPPSRYRNNRSR